MFLDERGGALAIGAIPRRRLRGVSSSFLVVDTSRERVDALGLRVAKPANRGSRIAFEKPRAGARPPSPVSPLTPSGVVISPLSISLRGVRKSLA